MHDKYTVPLDFDIEGFKEAITRYKGADIYAPSPAIYSIPFSDLEIVRKDSRLLLIFKTEFELYFERLGIPIIIKLCYNTSNLVILEVNQIMLLEKVLIDLKYGEHDKHISVIEKISKLVSKDGKLGVFVNNIPYWLELTLAVSTTTNYEAIIQIAQENHLQLDYSRGIPELIEDLKERRCYNFTEIGIDETYDEIEYKLRKMCLYPTISELKEKGYFPPTAKKKKLFISYCHKDKSAVHCIVDQLRSHGLDIWLDEYEIDFGDNLLSRIDQAIRECDMPLLFLSKSTPNANYAKWETSLFYRKIIEQSYIKKNWFLVKMDSVDFDNIYQGLGRYKYFNMTEESIESLFRAIYKKLYSYNYDETMA